MERRSFISKTSAAISGAIMVPVIVPSSVFGPGAPNDKINIGQIGCGRIARTHDMAETLIHDMARIIAVSDLDAQRMTDGKKLVEDYYRKKPVGVAILM